VSSLHSADLCRALFEESGDALFLLDPKTDQLLDVNSAAERLSGLTRTQLLAQPVTYWFRFGGRGGTSRLRQAASESGVFHSQEGFFLRTSQDGVWVPVNLTVSRLHLKPKTLALVTARDIRDRHEALSQLQKAESELRRVLTSVSDCLWSAEVDSEGRRTYRYLSPAVETITGRRPDFFLADARRYREVVHGEDRPRWEAIAIRLHAGETTQDEYRVIRPDGAVRWVRESVSASRGEGGRPLRLDGVLSDISERRRLEEELDRFFTLSLELLCIAGFDGRYKRLNPAWERTLGYDINELLTRPFLDFVHPDDQAATTAEFDRLLHGADTIRFENRYRCKDGSYRLLSWTAHPVMEQQVIYAAARDVTRRRQAEQSLERERNLLRTLMDNLPDHIFVKDTQSRFVTANAATLFSLGVITEELAIGKTDFDFLPRDRAAQYTADEQAVLRTGQPLTDREELLIDAGGRSRWLLTTKVPLRQGNEIVGLVGISHDITGRKHAEERLQAQARLLDLAHDAIIVCDANSHIRYWNRGAQTLYGWTAEEARGMESQALLKTVFPVSQQVIAEALSQVGHWEGTLTHTHRDGHQVVVESRQSLLRDSQGKVTRILEINRDVTDRLRAEVELRRAMGAAEAASRAKSEFLANMSHEIRTPMNGVLGMTELALDTPLSPEQRQYLELAHASAESLLAVINDVLDFSKIEAGKLDLDRAEFFLRECVDGTIKTLALRAHQKGLELACHIALAVPDALIGDPGRLRQILVNLVGNAIKFTEKGEVIVDVRAESVTVDEVRLHVAVADTGIGIPPEKRQMIFEAFVQADASTTRTYGGSGLGLTISNRLVEMMGGRIWVESAVDRGSTFHFTVCFGVQQHPPTRRLPSTLEGLPVLVVDDNSTNRQILEELLLGWRMKPTVVDGAPTALAALEKAEKDGEPFALILLDSDMPDMDGFALAKHIQLRPELAGARIMMLSTAGRPGDTARCQQMGIVRYLVKPMKQSELLDSIVMALEATFHPDATTAESPRPEGPGLRILLAEDNAVNQRLAVRLLEKQGHQVTVAVNGRKALEAIERQTFDLVLMDVQMPEMGGFEATAAIRAREQPTAHRLPIIAMTAHALKGDRERCLAAGMDGYVAKPIRAEELWHEIARVTAAPQLDCGARAGDFDRVEAMSRVDGDEGLLRELAKLFLTESPGWLAEAGAALCAGDAARLQRAAHTLKGAAGTFGARGAMEASAKLEQMGRSGNLTGAADAYRGLEEAVHHLRSALAALCTDATAGNRQV
jgi:PAS domain S-box-containing protein